MTSDLFQMHHQTRTELRIEFSCPDDRLIQVKVTQLTEDNESLRKSTFRSGS